MFTMILMILLSLTAAVLYFMLAGAALWKCTLLALGVFISLHVLFLLTMAVTALFIDMKKPIEKQNAVCRWGAKFSCFIVCFYFGIDLKVSGSEKLPEEGRFLMVCNHRSMFDPLTAIHAFSKFDLAFVSKPSNLRIPVVGPVMYGIGCLGIDRENDRNALKTILQTADYIKRDVCSMVIYPEGTRSKDSSLLPFHAGSFKAGQRAGVPLVIACSKGTEKVRKNFPFRRTVVELEILEVMDAESVKSSSTAELAGHSRSLMEKALG